MNSKMLVGAVAVAVWYLIWDMFLFFPIFGSFLANVQGMIEEPALQWIIVGNLVAGLVLAWFYGKVGSVFGSGVTGGLYFGVATGVLMGFPMWLFQCRHRGPDGLPDVALPVGLRQRLDLFGLVGDGHRQHRVGGRSRCGARCGKREDGRRRRSRRLTIGEYAVPCPDHRAGYR
jgi:hypothetical protein